MNNEQSSILGLFISTLSLLLATTPALAEPNITLTPSNVTVVGTRCLGVNFGCTTIKRQLLLQTNQALNNLQILSLDLNRADGATVFPATAIHPTLSAGSVPSNQPLAIPVQFDFGQAHSGEYSGVLLVIYTDGQLNIPITVRVKDHWLLPLLVLLLGLGMGIGVSAYRTEGRARDEIVVRVGRLRTQMRSDAELAKPFEAKITGYLVDVETALDNRNWEAAQQAINQAQAVWDKWRKGREDWLAQLDYQSSLVQRLEKDDLNPNSPCVQIMRTQLEDSVRAAADKDAPQQLRKELEDLQQQVNRYLDGKTKLSQFNQLLAKLPPEKELPWNLDLQRLQQGLDSLAVSDLEAFKNWQQDITTESDKLVAAIEPQPANKEANTQSPQAPQAPKAPQSLIAFGDITTTIVSNLLAPPPSARPIFQPNPERAARDRLRWFNLLSYIISVGLLAGAGFGELYAAKPTFGASGWSDYFALLAWGFGAEATRDAVTKVVQGWQLPGLKDRDVK